VAENFPTDEVTLTLLIAACEINPDTGRTHLMDFLGMGTRVKSDTLTEEDGPCGYPVYEREYEEGYAPFSEHQVIATLARELLAARRPGSSGGEHG
jgi:hypothetical protein